MTSRERFVRNYMIAASVGSGAFLALAAAEGLLVVGIVMCVMVVLSFAAVAYWLWTGQRRGEVSADATGAQLDPTHSKPDRRLIAGGLLNVALTIATIALVLAEKSGLRLCPACWLRLLPARWHAGRTVPDDPDDARQAVLSARPGRSGSARRSATMIHMGGVPDGPYSFVDHPFGLRYEGAYVRGVRDGLWRVTKVQTGAPCWEVTWSQGKWHGPSRSWYANGQQMDEGEYHDGCLAGLWTFWFPTGQIAARGCYEKDRKVGAWEYWDDAGQQIDGEPWERLYEHEYDYVAYDDYTGFPRGENWPDPPLAGSTG